MYLIKVVSLFWVMFFLSNKTIAQVNSSYYTLNGSVNLDSGTALLMPVGEDIYYPGNVESLNTSISNGKFVFKDVCFYRYEFRLGIKKFSKLIYVSDYFVVDSGTQNIKCNIDSLREIPDISNESMQEYKKSIVNIDSSSETDLRSLYYRYSVVLKSKDSQSQKRFLDTFAFQKERLFQKKREFLKAYINKRSDSYLAMWEMIRQFKAAYDTIYNSMFTELSDSVRHSYTGRILETKLNSARFTAIGSIFPRMTVYDRNKMPFEAFQSLNDNTFTLVDFWFSHCVPCIGQFPELTKIYQLYRKSGFSLIGISTDKEEAISNWKNAIKKYQLLWPQFIDIGGKNAIQLSILLYPSNFLLDKNMKIIKKNIEPSELKSFLEANLNDGY